MKLPVTCIMLLPLALAACARIPPAHDQMPVMEDIAAEIETLLQTVETADQAPATPTPRPRPIRIPRDAPWLGDVVSGTYQTTPVDAVRNLLQGRAIRWDLRHPAPNIIVIAPQGNQTIAEHLDYITTQANWSWSQNGGILFVTDFPTRHYLLHTIPGNLQASIPARAINSPIPASTGNIGAAGGLSQGLSADSPENNLAIEFNPLEELGNSLSQILTIDPPATMVQTLFDANPRFSLSATGPRGTYTIIPASNLVTVTASPSLHVRVADLIDHFNRGATGRVILTITVFELSFSDRNQRSIDLSLLREAAISSGIRITGPEFDLSDPNGITLDFTTQEGNAYDASNLLFSLLETQGQTSIRLHERFELVNNIPTSIADERVLPYVSEVSTGNQIGGALSTLAPQIRTSQLSTGIALNVIASIAAQTINVRLGFSLAQLVQFNSYEFGAGPSAIAGTLPTTDSQHRLFQMSLSDGDTRLIANVTKTSISDETANNAFGLLGGSRASDQAEQQTIIAVTAQLL